MGHAIGQLLKENELRVLTCLAGRSKRTRELSDQAGITDVPNLNELVEQSDVLMTVTVSEAVPGLCREIADAVKATGTDLLFAECNAIAPELSKEMEGVLQGAGARYVDASIIGGPPRNGSSPRIYVSGDNATEFEQLRDFGLDVRNLGPQLGRASGIKMCYAAITKGTAALYASTLMTAKSLGLFEDLIHELEGSQASTLAAMDGVNSISAKAFRWIGEMEEIAATFEDAGSTPMIHMGAAETFQRIADSAIGHERVDSIDRSRTLEQTVEQLVKKPG
jgi:3-hydroxyisobutyrate dehydrogenase-like beta-hydroxyacid dehydrogenase